MKIFINLDITPGELAYVLSNFQGGNSPVGDKLDRIQTILEKLTMNQTEELALLKAIDDATTVTGNNVQKIATNVQTIATTTATISSEIDALLANNDVPSNIATALQSVSERLGAVASVSQASSDALDAQVPVLLGIASKGAGTPVPVTPIPVDNTGDAANVPDVTQQ